jgi:hypothetical protein
MLLTPRQKKTIIAWILAVCLPLPVILPLYFCSDFGLSNACLVPGVVYLGLLGMAVVIRGGVFDVFNYQFMNFIYSWRKGSPHRYEDAYGYQTMMKERRRQDKLIWLPWTVVGTILLTLAIVFAFYPV